MSGSPTWIDASRWAKTPLSIVSKGSNGQILTSGAPAGAPYAAPWAGLRYPHLDSGDYNTSWYMDTSGSLASNSAYFNGNVGCLNRFDTKGKVIPSNSTNKGGTAMNLCNSGKPTYWAYNFDANTNTKDGGALQANYYSSVYVTNMCANPNKGLYWVDGTQYPDNPDCQWIEYDTAVQCCTTPTLSPQTVDKYCAPSYDPNPNNPTGCPHLMWDRCAGNWEDSICKPYITGVDTTVNARATIHLATENYISSHPNTNYTSKGGKLMKDDPFYSKTLPMLCQYQPGVVDDLLDTFCSVFTRDDCIRDSGIQTVCGCHLPSSEYPFSDQGIIPKPCDPVCQKDGTIQTGYEDDQKHWSPVQCEATICLIDDVVVNAMNSDVNVDISMFCGSCGKKNGGNGSDGGCVCWLHNVNVNEINSDTGKISIDQACGPSCFTFDQDARKMSVNCHTGNGGDNGNGNGDGNGDGDTLFTEILDWIKSNKTAVIIGVSVVVLIIVVILFLIMRRDAKSQEEPAMDSYDDVNALIFSDELV